MRSKEWPWGFPWLEAKALQKCEEANRFIKLMFELCRTASQAGSPYLLEHPEDLGAADDGSIPASIFALQDMFSFAQDTRATTIAFHQCGFLAPSAKATRIVTTLPLLPAPGVTFHRSWPSFNSSGHYKGPLPRRCGHRHKPILGRDTQTGIFRTAAAASYPDKMCLWLALMIVSFCQSSSKVGEVDKSVPALPERVPTSSSTLPSPAQHSLVPGSSVPSMVPGSSVPTKGAGPSRSLPGSSVPTETSLLRLGWNISQRLSSPSIPAHGTAVEEQT